MAQSWIIVSKSDQRIMFETWNYKIKEAVNTKRYDVYGIIEWLALHNQKGNHDRI